MARTAVLTKEQILESSFNIVNDMGLDKVTVREIAKNLNTSTAPIYTQYKNMDELKEDLSNYVDNKLLAYLKGSYSGSSFYNIGAGLLSFAYENQNVFRTYYLDRNTLQSYITNNSSQFVEQMKEDLFLNILDQDRLEMLIDDMWIYTFGLATIICTDKNKKELSNYLDKLEKTGERLIIYHFFSTGKIEKAFSLMKNRK